MESLLEYDELIKGVNGNVLGTNNGINNKIGSEDEIDLSSKISISNKKCFFTSVHTDSRNVCKDSLFVPLIGEVQNGHKYIPMAIEKGASVIFINNDEYSVNISMYNQLINENSDVLFIGVDNTLHGLQDAAEAYVNKKCKNMVRISITGSSGKTTTKEMMVSVCKAHFGENKVAYTKGNFNSETGLPLTAFSIRGDEECCVLEMGMNRVNEIGEISKILKSQYGIITNIGTAHIGILGSRENIALEKRKSLDYIPENGAAIVGADDDYSDFCCSNVKGKIIKFGKNIPESVSGVKFIKDDGLYGTDFSVDGINVHLPLSGEYNYLNALAVIACAKALSIKAEEIKSGLENISAVSGRMEVKEITLKNNKKFSVIKDCYNANLDSMSKVIDFCNNLKNEGKRIFVLADMKELGKESKKAHETIGQKIKNNMPEIVFLIGSEMENAYDLIGHQKGVFYFREPSEISYKKIADEICNVVEEKDVILLKGSHSMELEKLYAMLEER